MTKRSNDKKIEWLNDRMTKIRLKYRMTKRYRMAIRSND